MTQKGCLPTVCVIGENQMPKIIKDLWERHIIDKYGLHYLSWSSADIPQSGLSNLQFKYTKGLCVCVYHLLVNANRLWEWFSNNVRGRSAVHHLGAYTWRI